MIHHVIQILVSAVAVLVAAKVVPGIRVKSFGGAVIFAIVLAVLGKVLGGVLMVMSLPFILVTFGLGYLIALVVINAFLFWLADQIVKGVEVDGFGSALFGSLVCSFTTWGISLLLR